MQYILILAFAWACGAGSTAGISNCQMRCEWHCERPVCQAVCAQVCQPPVCESLCAEGPQECGDPICTPTIPSCSVSCQTANSTCTGCPECATHCQPSTCVYSNSSCTASPNCITACGPTRCAYQCCPPSDCPKPTCELRCQTPTCAVTNSTCSDVTNGCPELTRHSPTNCNFATCSHQCLGNCQQECMGCGGVTDEDL